jgi:hypothetical protein
LSYKYFTDESGRYPTYDFLVTSRIRRRDCSLPLFSERYVKLSLHTAQAFSNPLIGQQLFVMVSVMGLQILLILFSTFFCTSVSFWNPCLSFLETKYSVSMYGFLSNFNKVCRTILVSYRNFSCLSSIEKTQFRSPTVCQYLPAIQFLDLPLCLSLLGAYWVYQVLHHK